MANIANYGMDKKTGKRLYGTEHLKQSIIDILTTRKGTRLKRRAYGSNLFNLIDKPINSSLLLNVYADTAEALIENEPRIILNKLVINEVKKGFLNLTIFYNYIYDDTENKINNIGLSYG